MKHYDLDNLFTYHPPTDEEKPVYAKTGLLAVALVSVIRHVHERVYETRNVLLSEQMPPRDMTPNDVSHAFDAINKACRQLAEHILSMPFRGMEEYALAGSLLELQLARMSANELVCAHIRRVNSGAGDSMLEFYERMALEHITRARFLANLAVATRERT